MKRFFAICTAFVVIPLVAYAQLSPPPPTVSHAGGGGAVGKWWKSSAIVRTLELSETQVAQLEQIYLTHQALLAGLRSALLTQEAQLRTLLQSELLDEKSIATQRQAISAARTALETENSEMALEMRRVMTAEQWRKLEKIRQESPVPAPPPLPPQPPISHVGTIGHIVYDVKTPGIQEPMPISRKMPPYTPEARAAKVEGVVLLEAIIRKDGTVGEVKVLRGIGYGMDESAASTLKTWRFQPAQLNGQPVDVRANIEMSFRLF